MAAYNDIFTILYSHLNYSEGFSLPIPIVLSNRLYDVFFTFFVDSGIGRVEPPESCLAVYYEQRRAVNIGDAFGFSSIECEDDALCPIENFRDNTLEARALYGQVRDEAAAGEKGEATKRYFELIRKTSQPCLLPYYRALGAEFDD